MPMIFYHNELSLSIDDSVNDLFQRYISSYDFRIESGGIIIGILNPANNQIVITDVTEPCIKDKRSPFSYIRSSHGHQEIMDRLWEESNQRKTYLGEWHTHCQESPIPSKTDIKNWTEISRRSHNSSDLFFIIVGTRTIKIWIAQKGTIKEMQRIEI